MISRIRKEVFGTYIKATTGIFGADGTFLVLYLHYTGLYLFIGYMSGYDLTVAAGRWWTNGTMVKLKGVGRQIITDVRPAPPMPEFHRRYFRWNRDESTPVLTTVERNSDQSTITAEDKKNLTPRELLDKMVAENDARKKRPRWGVLDWPGNYYFIGKYHFYELPRWMGQRHLECLPGSHDEIEPWIKEFIENHPSKRK